MDAPPEPGRRLGGTGRFTPSASLPPPPLQASLPPLRPGPRPGGGVCGVRGGAGRIPAVEEGRGRASLQSLPGAGGPPLTLGEHLSHPPRRQEKFFSPPGAPPPPPTPCPAGVGLGPLVKKVTRSHQLLLPLGTGLGGLEREAGSAGDPGGPLPPQERRVPGLKCSRVPAEDCPHQCVSACRAAAASNLLYSCLQRHSERARRGREGVCLQSAAPWCSEAAAPAPTLIHFAG